MIVCFEVLVKGRAWWLCSISLPNANKPTNILSHFHADIERVCHFTSAKFSIYTSTFYFAHSTLPYIFVNETLPYVLIHTSIFFCNKPTLPKKHCSWELSLTKCLTAKGSSLYMPVHEKTNKIACAPAKTQISLGIRPV